MKGVSLPLSDALASMPGPVIVSPKIDGIRCIFTADGRALSCSLKPLPNKYLSVLAAAYAPYLRDAGLALIDCELSIGPGNAPRLLRATTDVVMSEQRADIVRCALELQVHAFDCLSNLDTATAKANLYVEPASSRLARLRRLKLQMDIHLPDAIPAPQLVGSVMDDRMDVERACEMHISEGYEGSMIRPSVSGYKFGRGTAKEFAAGAGLVKIKPFDDCEAVVVGIEEEMANSNEAVRQETGLLKRSSRASGKRGKGVVGCLIVRVVNGPFAGVESRISSLTRKDREAWFDDPRLIVGKTVKMSYFAHGDFDAPRHPKFRELLGIRHPLDMPLKG